MTRIPRCHRTAFTLIEMLITIAIGSSVMVTSAALLHKSFELHKTAQDRIQRGRLLDRLIQQFRSDVYAAIDFEILTPSRLNLNLVDGDRVVYSTVDNQLGRELQNGLREPVELGHQITARFDLTRDSKRVSLKLLHEPTPEMQIVRREFEATIGRLSTYF